MPAAVHGLKEEGWTERHMDEARVRLLLEKRERRGVMKLLEWFARWTRGENASSTLERTAPSVQTNEVPAGHWIMRKGDKQGVIRDNLSFRRSISVKWVNTADKGMDGTARERIPSETIRTYTDGEPFRAAGRNYVSLEQLTVVKDERGVWCRDVHGREVFCVAERFPCFDSYDFLYEERCYRWFYIREKGRLTCIYHADGEKTFTVTEDMEMLGDNSWNCMLREGYVRQDTGETAGD